MSVNPSKSLSCAVSFVVGSLAVLHSAAEVSAQGQRDQVRRPDPTHADVSYGSHERHRLDVWVARSEEPAPMAVYIHGGGFRGGRKEGINGRTVQQLLDAGISVAAVEYRLLEQAFLPAAHEDCRRAIQFLRRHADRWNIDKSRIGTFGGSAGAQLSMWLAFHDEMAQPESDDPVSRESTRVQAVATNGGQATMDFSWWLQNIPGYQTPHRQPSEYFGNVNEAQRQAVVEDISALSLLGPGDPPIWMSYGMSPEDEPPTEPQQAQGWRVHHVSFGVALAEAAERHGVEAHLNYPGRTSSYKTLVEFFQAKLAR